MKEHMPTGLAIIPPIVSSIIIGVGAWLIAYGMGMGEHEVIAHEYTYILSGSGAILGFFWGTLVWTDKLARIYKPGTMRKLDAETPKEPGVVRIELREDNDGYFSAKYIDLPAEISMEQLKAIATHLVSNGFVFSHALSGRHMPLNRSQFEVLRDLLISRGLAKWNNPQARNQGVVLTKAGESLFRKLATHSNGKTPKMMEALA